MSGAQEQANERGAAVSTGNLFEHDAPAKPAGQPRFMCHGYACIHRRPRHGSYCTRCLTIQNYVRVYRATGAWPEGADGQIVQTALNQINTGKI